MSILHTKFEELKSVTRSHIYVAKLMEIDKGGARMPIPMETSHVLKKFTDHISKILLKGIPLKRVIDH